METKKGRPKKYDNEKERKKAQHKSRSRFKNVAISPDLLKRLGKVEGKTNPDKIRNLLNLYEDGAVSD